MQYGKNVWALNGTDDEITDKAIVKTEEFFKSLGLPIRFTDVDLNETAIQPILDQLSEHGFVKLGEHKKIDLTVSEKILKMAV